MSDTVKISGSVSPHGLITPPSESYAIWSTQRTGSSLLCKALELTGVAGTPGESIEGMKDKFGRVDPAVLRSEIWNRGISPSGVFGAKVTYYLPTFSEFLATFTPLVPQTSPQRQATAQDLWATIFPNCRHVFMTRRNKVRLAVSWWRAICSNEWHRTRESKQIRTGQGNFVDANENHIDLTEAYDFNAIRHLYCEAAMREAGIQEFYDKLDIVPLTIVYEDFVADFEATVAKVLDHLGLFAADTQIAPPFFDKLADDLSDSWAIRFKNELQADWQNKGW